MADRRAKPLLQAVRILLRPRLQNISRHTYKPERQIYLKGRLHNHINIFNGTPKRTLHTTASLMVAKLLTLEDVFARASLQDYLKKMENEYNECLKAVNNSESEEHPSEEELRAKRTKVLLMASVVQSIRALNVKEKEIAETETLLKGELNYYPLSDL